MMRRSLHAATAAALAWLFTDLCAAQTIPFDLETLASRSQVVAVGRCAEVRSAWNEKRTLIHTWATYEIEQAVPEIKVHDGIVVKALGGTVGTITQVVLDGPQFAVGDRDLLFLVPSDEAGAYQLFGLGQGKVPVRRSTGAGRDLVRLPPPDGLQRSPGREAGVSSPSAPGEGPPGKGLFSLQPLDGVLGSVRRHNEQKGGGR